LGATESGVAVINLPTSHYQAVRSDICRGRSDQHFASPFALQLSRYLRKVTSRSPATSRLRPMRSCVRQERVQVNPDRGHGRAERFFGFDDEWPRDVDGFHRILLPFVLHLFYYLLEV
jgi:hypothetical protein